MLITEWQTQFLAAVKAKRFNVYPPAMINSLLEIETDVVAFKAKVKAFFSKYETATVTTSGGASDKDPLSPRALWLLSETIAGVATPVILTEEGDKPILQEDEKPLALEKEDTLSEE